MERNDLISVILPFCYIVNFIQKLKLKEISSSSTIVVTAVVVTYILSAMFQGIKVISNFIQNITMFLNVIINFLFYSMKNRLDQEQIDKANDNGINFQ